MEKQNLKNELSRTYHYADGETLTIKDPAELHWKRDEFGDSHRIVIKSGEVFCPRRNWLAVSWEPRNPQQPVQF